MRVKLTRVNAIRRKLKSARKKLFPAVSGAIKVSQSPPGPREDVRHPLNTKRYDRSIRVSSRIRYEKVGGKFAHCILSSLDLSSLFSLVTSSESACAAHSSLTFLSSASRSSAFVFASLTYLEFRMI